MDVTATELVELSHVKFFICYWESFVYYAPKKQLISYIKFCKSVQSLQYFKMAYCVVDFVWIWIMFYDREVINRAYWMFENQSV